MVKTLTWDHRRDMTRWADIEKTLTSKFIFVNPAHPGNNQQTNKPTPILHRPLPKHTNLNIAKPLLATIKDSNQQHAQKTP